MDESITVEFDFGAADATVAAFAVTPATPAEVRTWANANGVEIGLRGRIKADVKEAFTAATKRDVA